MALTVDQIDTIRASWIVWDPPTDADLQARSDVLGGDSIFPVVIEQIRAAIARLSSPTTPAQFTIVGDYSQNTGKNIDALRLLLADAEAAYHQEVITAQGGADTASLVRKDPNRGSWYGRTPVA